MTRPNLDVIHMRAKNVMRYRANRIVLPTYINAPKEPSYFIIFELNEQGNAREIGQIYGEDNVDFIIHARENIIALLKYIEELETVMADISVKVTIHDELLPEGVTAEDIAEAVSFRLAKAKG